MTSGIKKIIHKSLSMFGYRMVKAEAPASVIENVFATAHPKTALLSYIKSVFVNRESRSDLAHTNRYTTILIAETLEHLGYNVDVVDYGEVYHGDINRYSLVIGLGKTLEYVIRHRQNKPEVQVICFGTGCNPLFSNVSTLQRLSDVYRRSGRLMLSSVRYISEDTPLQHGIADWIILHGSTFARSTYHTENISCIHAPVFIYHSVTRTDEEWMNAKKNYLWFGNGGLVHKGLDLTIEAFQRNPDVHLHICGNMESEPDFYNYYKPIINACSNMTYHGFVNVNSGAFAHVLRSCAFVVFPSASEGNSPSVITCMANGGLIPIITKNADVDLNGYGIYINELSANAVEKSVALSQALTIKEIKEQSAKITAETRHLNSFDYFKQDFAQKLREAINAMPL